MKTLAPMKGKRLLVSNYCKEWLKITLKCPKSKNFKDSIELGELMYMYKVFKNEKKTKCFK